MTAVIAQLTDLSDRALLLLILERQNTMTIDITSLQDKITVLVVSDTDSLRSQSDLITSQNAALQNELNKINTSTP